MNKTEEMQRFENTLVVKNQLLGMDTEEIVDIYEKNEVDRYMAFVATIAWMLDHEQAFFCVNSAISDKVRAVIDVHKDKIIDDKTYGALNEIKIYLNAIDTADPKKKNLVVEQYRMYHETIRNARLTENQVFLDTLGTDAFVYFYLKGEDNLPAIEYVDELLLFSIAYFIEICPSFFRDENVYNKTIEELDDLDKHTSLFNVAVKKLLSSDKKMVKKIYKGE